MKKRIILIVSVVAGVIAAVMTRFYLSAKDAEVKQLKSTIERRYGTMEVLCFARDVPSGTPLAKADLGLKTVPAIGLRGQALTVENVTDIVGRKLLLGHRIGEVVFWADIEGGDPTAKGLSADIKKGMRAISISCTGAASVSGMVKPNDHVDVIGTFELGDGKANREKRLVTCTVLQNVLVLATGSETSKNRSRADLSPANAFYSTVTLEVTPREAEMIAFAEQIRGRLVLTLRNRSDVTSEKDLPSVDFEKIRETMEQLNQQRQQQRLSNR